MNQSPGPATETNLVTSAVSRSKVEKLGSESFRILKVTLAPKTQIIGESGSMASQEVQIQTMTVMNGSFWQALALKFLGEESFFINYFQNPDSVERSIYLSQTTPGEIIEREVNGEKFYIQPGSFIARTTGIQTTLRWAGFASFFGGEGLFRIEISGQGKLWYGCYGAVIEKEIQGDYIVDSGHLLSYPSHFKLSLKTAGGILTSLLTREGFVLKLNGNGKILLQTRSIKGLADWLNPRFWR